MTKIKTVWIPHKIRIPLRERARRGGGLTSNNFSLPDYYYLSFLKCCSPS